MNRSGGFVRPYDHDARAPFIEQIDRACRDLGVELRWFSDSWIGLLSYGVHRGHIVGYTFGLNDSAAVELAVDKTATAAVLSAHSIPVVAHEIFTFGDLSSADAAFQIATKWPPPIVFKPARESDGLDVRRADTVDDLEPLIGYFRTRHAAIAVSPLVTQPEEYRVVVLDGHALLVFRKMMPAGSQGSPQEWRHNAVFGSVAELVSDTAPIWPHLSSLGRRTLSALGLRVGAVDIFGHTGNLSVLEVNDAFSLNGFSLQSPRHFDLSQRIFREIIEAWCLTAKMPEHPKSRRQ